MPRKLWTSAAAIILAVFVAHEPAPAQEAAGSLTWAALGGPVAAYRIRAMAYDAVRDILYVGCSSSSGSTSKSMGVWRCLRPASAPAWKKLSGPANIGPFITDSLVLDTVRNILYAGTTGTGSGHGGGVWRAKNPSLTPVWSRISLGTEIDTFLGIGGLILDSARNALYVSDRESLIIDPYGKGVWLCKTPNTKPVWKKISGAGNVGGWNIGGLALDGQRNILFAGTYAWGVWRCRKPNTAWSWTNISKGGDLGWGLFLLYDPSHDALYEVKYAGVVFRCARPGGQFAWKLLSPEDLLGEGDRFKSLAYDGTGNCLYAATEAHGIWRCETPEATPLWSSTGGALSAEGVESLFVHLAGGVIFAGTTKSGVWLAHF